MNTEYFSNNESLGIDSVVRLLELNNLPSDKANIILERKNEILQNLKIARNGGFLSPYIEGFRTAITAENLKLKPQKEVQGRKELFDYEGDTTDKESPIHQFYQGHLKASVMFRGIANDLGINYEHGGDKNKLRIINLTNSLFELSLKEMLSDNDTENLHKLADFLHVSNEEASKIVPWRDKLLKKMLELEAGQNVYYFIEGGLAAISYIMVKNGMKKRNDIGIRNPNELDQKVSEIYKEGYNFAHKLPSILKIELNIEKIEKAIVLAKKLYHFCINEYLESTK